MRRLLGSVGALAAALWLVYAPRTENLAIRGQQQVVAGEKLVAASPSRPRLDSRRISAAGSVPPGTRKSANLILAESSFCG
jgi:hypothetical protein